MPPRTTTVPETLKGQTVHSAINALLDTVEPLYKQFGEAPITASLFAKVHRICQAGQYEVPGWLMKAAGKN